MRIDGAWLVCDDGVLRPVLRGEVLAHDGSMVPVIFLVDSGADRTVFNEDTWDALGFPVPAATSQVEGIGGRVSTVEIATSITMPREGGALVQFNGRFAAFTDPTALDMSVLGRDILNLFAVIVDRPRDAVCLLAQNHVYEIRQQ